MRVAKRKIGDKANYDGAIVSDKVRDHGNDPFVLKKLEEAKAFLLKNGLNGLPDLKK